MRVVLIDFMSIDGVVQAPGGPEEDTDGGFAHGGWSHPYFDVEVMGPAIDATMTNATALLYGRRTYAGMAAAWPDRAGDPFADKMNAIPKYVASRTLTQDDLTWSGSQLLDPADAVGAVAKLRSEDGGDLLIWGSSDFARQLVAADLVDEYVLLLEPILLGGGKSVFPTDGKARPLQLVDVTQAGTGTLVCRYRPAT